MSWLIFTIVVVVALGFCVYLGHPELFQSDSRAEPNDKAQEPLSDGERLQLEIEHAHWHGWM